MVRLWFAVKRAVPGIPGTGNGMLQEVCLQLGKPRNIVVRTEFTVPEGEVFSLIGNALADGSLEDLTPDRMTAEVSEALRAAVGGQTPHPPSHGPAGPTPCPLDFRRWRRARSPLQPVP